MISNLDTQYQICFFKNLVWIYMYLLQYPDPIHIKKCNIPQTLLPSTYQW